MNRRCSLLCFEVTSTIQKEQSFATVIRYHAARCIQKKLVQGTLIIVCKLNCDSIYMTRVSLIPDFDLQRNYSAVAASAQTVTTDEIKVNVKPSEEEIIRILRTCQAVCFDVDSTVIPEEGIDELAAFKGVGEAVADLTKK